MTINGYELTSELKTDKSGFSKWGYAMKNGQAYFIKEFLSPVYPIHTEMLEESIVERKKKICTQYENSRKRFYADINSCMDGNLVRITEFFRYRSKYYITTEMIPPIPWKTVAGLPQEDQIRLCMILLHSIGSLHALGIIHADIKMDNIIFKKTGSGKITAKVIDFDNSFYESQQPSNVEDIHGDMPYLAPETYELLEKEEGKLTTAIDVFALGLVFHQIITGELPDFDHEKYHYAFEAVLCGEVLKCDERIPFGFRDTLNKMLLRDPEERISIAQIRKMEAKTIPPQPSVEKSFTEKGGRAFSMEDDDRERLVIKMGPGPAKKEERRERKEAPKEAGPFYKLGDL